MQDQKKIYTKKLNKIERERERERERGINFFVEKLLIE